MKVQAAGKIRIIGGAWRGRALAVPADGAVRPTSDRAREAVFNRLTHSFAGRGFRLVGAHVADVCAGTGAFGFEALSRGAAHAVLIERDPAVAATLKRSVAALGAEDRATIIVADATAPPPAPEPCDLILIDPPFDAEMTGPALSALAKRGWFKPGALAVVESETGRPPTVPTGFTLLDQRRYGRITFSFYAAENLPAGASLNGRASAATSGSDEADD